MEKETAAQVCIWVREDELSVSVHAAASDETVPDVGNPEKHSFCGILCLDSEVLFQWQIGKGEKWLVRDSK